MAAGVHDADLLAGFAGGGDVAGVGEAGLFSDGEGVHVAADEEGGAGAIVEEADYAEGSATVWVDAYVLGDGIAGGAEVLCEECGGLALEVGELGVGVDLFVDIEEGGGLGCGG